MMPERRETCQRVQDLEAKDRDWLRKASDSPNNLTGGKAECMLTADGWDAQEWDGAGCGHVQALF